MRAHVTYISHPDFKWSSRGSLKGQIGSVPSTAGEPAIIPVYFLCCGDMQSIVARSLPSSRDQTVPKPVRGSWSQRAAVTKWIGHGPPSQKIDSFITSMFSFFPPNILEMCLVSSVKTRLVCLLRAAHPARLPSLQSFVRTGGD